MLNVGNRGFVDAFLSPGDSTNAIAEHRGELLRTLSGLAERAKSQGRARADFTIDDLVLILLASRGLSTIASGARTAVAHRFSALALDAISTTAARATAPR